MLSTLRNAASKKQTMSRLSAQAAARAGSSDKLPAARIARYPTLNRGQLCALLAGLWQKKSQHIKRRQDNITGNSVED